MRICTPPAGAVWQKARMQPPCLPRYGRHRGREGWGSCLHVCTTKVSSTCWRHHAVTPAAKTASKKRPVLGDLLYIQAAPGNAVGMLIPQNATGMEDRGIVGHLQGCKCCIRQAAPHYHTCTRPGILGNVCMFVTSHTATCFGTHTRLHQWHCS